MKNNNLIYLPFDNLKNIGGPATFMNNLKRYFDNKRFSYLKTPEKAKVIFFPISFSKEILNNLKKKGGKIIQRLDGVHYLSKHGRKYLDLNKDIKDIYLNYADFVIFQSKYCQKQCFSMFGKKNKNQYTIIPNGVNKRIFYPQTKKFQPKKDSKIKMVTTGNFRNKDMLEPIIKALDNLKTKLNFELIVVGPVTSPALENYLKRDYLVYVGAKKIAKVAGILRKSHLFIYSHLNPPCPNSVIEAVSCGLPVVGFASGAMTKLLFFGKDLLAFVSHDIFQKYKDFDSIKLTEKILLAIENYNFYKKRALDYSFLYSFEECGKKYLDIFQKYLQY